MKILKIFLILLLIYVGIVFTFESLLGYFQPDGDGMVTISTTDENGLTRGRVVAQLESSGNLYIAANHWPRAWYRQALANSDVTVESQGMSNNYTAVPVIGDEDQQVNSDNPLPSFFRFLTGFPPRYFIRLDPK
jgi:hypothetical protein